jgi:hypothetical protein
MLCYIPKILEALGNTIIKYVLSSPCLSKKLAQSLAIPSLNFKINNENRVYGQG